MNQNRAPIFCFDAFSLRESASTSLEKCSAWPGRRFYLQNRAAQRLPCLVDAKNRVNDACECIQSLHNYQKPPSSRIAKLVQFYVILSVRQPWQPVVQPIIKPSTPLASSRDRPLNRQPDAFAVTLRLQKLRNSRPRDAYHTIIARSLDIFANKMVKIAVHAHAI